MLSYTHPAFDDADESHLPVFESIATHSPLRRTSGVLHARQPEVPVAKQESQSGLQSTHVDVAPLKNIREAHLTKVPFESAVEAVMHLVASVEEAASAPWHVKQVPVGPEHVAHDGSQAGRPGSQSASGEVS